MGTTVMFSNQQANGASTALDVSQVSEASIFVMDGWQGAIRFFASIDGGTTFPIPVVGIDRRTGQPVEDLISNMIPQGGLQLKFPDVKDYTTLRAVLNYTSGSSHATGYADAGHNAMQVADGGDLTLGAKADAPATVADTTPFSVIALLKGLWNKLAGTLTVQLSGSNTRKAISAALTLDEGIAHTAGNVVSTTAGTYFTFATGLPAGNSGIILKDLVTLNQNAVFSGGVGYTLHLYTAAPTAIADNGSFSIPVATDLPNYIGYITISTLVLRGANCAAMDVGQNFDFTLASGSSNLYGILVCNGAETTISGKIINVILGIAAL